MLTTLTIHFLSERQIMQPDYMNLDEKPEKNNRGYLLHPATLPHALGSLSIVIFIPLFLLSDPSTRTWLMPSFGVFWCFLLGLSGLIILYGGEYASPSGKLVRGWRAYLRGIFHMLVGWGLVLGLLAQLLRK
jgi:hypothetical protein